MEPRVAVVHDKLWQFGGGERVARELCGLWPSTDLFTSTFDPRIVREFGFTRVSATWLQRAPRLRSAHHFFLPLYDRAFRALDLSAYDLVLSSSAMFAKSVQPPAGVPHLCYCHTPPRFLWDLGDEAIAELPNRAGTKALVAAMARWLRRVDLKSAENVDHFVANSAHVAARIKTYYGREAEVIHPPVDVEAMESRFEKRREHVVVLARLFPYKRVDIAIEACNRLKLPLEVVGEGTDRARLEGLAGPTVRFRGWVSESEKVELLQSARLLIAPQVEDFGIAIVEAIAAGTPVLSFRGGGALEIIDEGVSGAFFDRQEVDALADALAAFSGREFDPSAMRASVRRFSAESFAGAIRRRVAALVV
jgi:glycosyltransferase involved in cell wall biosynthesis